MLTLAKFAVGGVVWGEDYDQLGGRLATCSDADFPVQVNGTQILGLVAKHDGDATFAACQTVCCTEGATCEVYEWIPHGAGLVAGCWTGKWSTPSKSSPLIVSRARAGVPTPPPTAPPRTRPYAVDDSALGMRWEGVGAISGGGATTKLLMDYQPDVVSDILDFMFKPNFGLDLDILKVEMGGDTDSTEGAEPSHMHSGPGDEDYARGYEWWLMKEAKKRKPSLKLYGLPWGWPGWLDPTATSSKEAKNAFADPEITANYTLAFLLGAKREHGLTIDYMGQWNERDAPKAYNDALRKVVSENAELAGATTVLNRLPHYPCVPSLRVPVLVVSALTPSPPPPPHSGARGRPPTNRAARSTRGTRRMGPAGWTKRGRFSTAVARAASRAA